MVKVEVFSWRKCGDKIHFCNMEEDHPMGHGVRKKWRGKSDTNFKKLTKNHSSILNPSVAVSPFNRKEKHQKCFSSTRRRRSSEEENVKEKVEGFVRIGNHVGERSEGNRNDKLEKISGKKTGRFIGATSLITVYRVPHVFTSVLFCISLLSSLLIHLGSGLGVREGPECEWSVIGDIERLTCDVMGTRSGLIVEDSVHGIGPENSKSLWVTCHHHLHHHHHHHHHSHPHYSEPFDTYSDSSGNGKVGHTIVPQPLYATSSSSRLSSSSSSSSLSSLGYEESNDARNRNEDDGFVLSHGVFMAVPNLRDLHLEQCHITGITPGALSYLPYLQNLTIRAHTSLSRWPTSSSTMLLDIKQGVFRGLPDLQNLDLSTTSISSLPQDFLCSLPSLLRLNLTGCWLRDFKSVGIMGPGGGLDAGPTSGPSRISNTCGSQIKSLDLSANHFTLLPPNTLTNLVSLEELRVEQNSVTIAAEKALVGLSKLKIISLAGNQLTSLPPEFFKDNRELVEIHLQNNSLGVLAPGLLIDLEHLVVLDLSHNQLTTEWVNGETFKGLVRLIVLNLAYNQLTKIDSMLFRDLYSLQVLNLEYNDISFIAEDAFSAMYNLHNLRLSHNQLKVIDKFVCNGLFVLSFLELGNNKIETVEPSSFKNCTNIQDLNLSGNQMKEVPKALGSLNLLRTLDLGENKIVDIRNASYEGLPDLYGLRLTDNRISHVYTGAFQNLPSLKIVNLAKNNISSIEPGTFDHNGNLQAVRLDSNRLTNIHNLFINIPNLLWLNISNNLLEDLSYEEFPPALQWLDLRANKIHTLGTCVEQDNLRIRNLDLSLNFIEEVGSANLPDSIENLVLAHNHINQIQPYTFFRKLNLTRVDLSHNQLVRLDQNALRLSPSRLTLSGQQEQESEQRSQSGGGSSDFSVSSSKGGSGGGTRVPPATDANDANENNMRSSSGGGTVGGTNGPHLTHDPARSEFYLGHNPLECDCTMEWLQNINKGDAAEQYPLIRDAGHVKCTLPFDRAQVPVSYMTLAAEQFLCKYESHCFSLCHCCDFEACDCEMTCPSNCTCYHDQGWGTNVVDCSMLRETRVPGRIPMDATQLYLDGNVFPNLRSHGFIGRKNLKALFLNASRVERIENRTFHGLSGLRWLHLENNFLERIEGFEFEETESLEELYLHENNIGFIGSQSFSGLKKLRVLTLHGNNLIGLEIWQVMRPMINNYFHSMSYGGMGKGEVGDPLPPLQISLRGNEWSCECGFATNLKDWMMEYRSAIVDADQVQCVDQLTTSSKNDERQVVKTELIVVRLLEQENHRCGEHGGSGGSKSVYKNMFSGGGAESKLLEDEGSTSYVALIACLVGAIGFLLLLLVPCYYWRKDVQVWLHAHCGLRFHSCREPPTERDKLFDAFVSYSSKDEAWVRQVLAAELERNDPPYRLCLRYRDLPTSGTYLADTIVQACEASRRTLLVLSHHFLKGEWSRSDVKSAHHSILKDRNRQVIIILLGDLPSKDLDPDVRLYLKNHTYLNCADKKFWHKLRFALPDVKCKIPLFRSRLHGGGNSTRTNTHRTSTSTTSASYHQYEPQPMNQQAVAAAAAIQHYQTILSPPHSATSGGAGTLMSTSGIGGGTLQPPPLPPSSHSQYTLSPHSNYNIMTGMVAPPGSMMMTTTSSLAAAAAASSGNNSSCIPMHPQNNLNVGQIGMGNGVIGIGSHSSPLSAIVTSSTTPTVPHHFHHTINNSSSSGSTVRMSASSSSSIVPGGVVGPLSGGGGGSLTPTSGGGSGSSMSKRKRIPSPNTPAGGSTNSGNHSHSSSISSSSNNNNNSTNNNNHGGSGVVVGQQPFHGSQHQSSHHPNHHHHLHHHQQQQQQQQQPHHHIQHQHQGSGSGGGRHNAIHI